MAVRTMVHIDEDKCDGCGLCVPDCAEGALQIIDGKAKLVSDIYCDGLGACLGSCPRDAITMVKRDADEYDEEAVNGRLKDLGRDPLSHDHDHGHGTQADPPKAQIDDLACGCPGTLSQSFDRPRQGLSPRVPAAAPVASGGGCPGSRAQQFARPEVAAQAAQGRPMASRLGNWPVQIMLVPPKAPYFDGADLLIAADCAPFAYGDFHRRFMEGRTLLVGCPKLDNTDIYVDKLTAIFRNNDIRSIGVVYMEVPCCTGLVHLARTALEKSGKAIPTTLYRIGIKGDFVEERALDQPAA
ncbi:MAG: 4Fe-4S binding protein [bacterium]|nr:4Fe-4S binding protein [bacterium]MDT8395555.1 4Fe-4S binding protein [bacterium]